VGKKRSRRFWLHVNYFGEPRRRVWTVRTGGRNYYLTHVDVFVRVFTRFRGQRAGQPKAFLYGDGVLRITRSTTGNLRIGEITPR
jgi:hypothetical protein